jgi:hypothetical protein
MRYQLFAFMLTVGRGTSFQDGVAAGEGFLCAPSPVITVQREFRARFKTELILVWCVCHCYCPPIWPSALPLNLTYISTDPSKLSLGSPPYTIIRISYPYSVAWVHYPKNPSRSEALSVFRNKFIFYSEGLLAPRPTPSWRTTPCRLSAAAYSIYSQLPSIAGARSSISIPSGIPTNVL